MVLARHLALMSGALLIPWIVVDNFLELVERITAGELHKLLFVAAESSSWNLLRDPEYIFSRQKPARMISALRQKFERDSYFQISSVLPTDSGSLSPVNFLFSTFAATDPKDYVYAIIGLLDWKLVPDYNMSVKEIYCHFTRGVFEQTTSLSFLQHCGLGYNYVNEWGLPSFILNLQEISDRPVPHHFVRFQVDLAQYP